MLLKLHIQIPEGAYLLPPPPTTALVGLLPPLSQTEGPLLTHTPLEFGTPPSTPPPLSGPLPQTETSPTLFLPLQGQLMLQ
jgi:hypothetical protein